MRLDTEPERLAWITANTLTPEQVLTMTADVPDSDLWLSDYARQHGTPADIAGHRMAERSRIAHTRWLDQRDREVHNSEVQERAAERARIRANNPRNANGKRPPYHAIVEVDGKCKACGRDVVQAEHTRSGWKHRDGWAEVNV